ncbi:GDSL-type esterase/lipase family protein [Bacillus sp. Marseille-Q1617]|uniref:SGNH/GDSL hydrolase family protein n=1 Tax=Bacillus sp. Marseille-Q1617 TaxID=2736887 RepID=UPI00158EBACE|nr:GDSL-type esterase/lipase family protein [Bacillus sp. Marseille-Q1617]
MKIGLFGDSLTEGRPGVSFVKLLKERFPQDDFDNQGKPGETLKSLYARLVKEPVTSDYDLSFLWIGVNDVYSKLLKVQAKTPVSDHEEFRELFEKLISLLSLHSERVIAVTPALIGEQTENEHNRELHELSFVIQIITSKHTSVDLLNMHEVFKEHFSGGSSSDFINTRVLSIMKDALFYKNINKIDRLSAKRGLRFTLDVIHLNSKGALIAADEYAKLIEQYTC